MTFLTRLVCCLLVACALSSPAHAAELKRGLNIAAWLANAPRQPLYARDFAQIRDAGFDHLRLPFNPEYYGYKMEEGASEDLNLLPLDRALVLADQVGLPVILDIHVNEGFYQALETHVWAEKKFIRLWQSLAEHYKARSDRELMFELLNEPQYYNAEDTWNRLAQRTVSTIRKISPTRPIVIGAPHGSEIDGLRWLKPLRDANIIYAFHFYEPYMISLQGVHMGFSDRMLRYFRRVPYPASLAQGTAATYAPNASDPAKAQRELETYRQENWNADTIRARIQIAAAWAKENKVRLVCGEFGVLRNHIDPESRYRWIKDVRTALEESKIPWQLWDYSDLAGIARPIGATTTDPVDGSVQLVDPLHGRRQIEPEALTALGLAGK